MGTVSGDRHMCWLGPLLWAAVCAVVTALLIPVGRWAWSAPGLITLFLLFQMLGDWGVIRKRTAAGICAGIYIAGALWVCGFINGLAHRQADPYLDAYRQANHKLFARPVLPTNR